ncbi:MAG TPA: ATP-dependent zinc metalloprotease FtsH [Clostridiaceae bacterium]|jgi:cell division protease FtsH|nr:ATP-dependent zinc metalloprotease FtsH [Clostridiaceae bacterium]
MKDKPKNNDKLLYLILGIITVICVVLITILTLNNGADTKENLELAYTDLIKKIDNKEVEKVEMTVGSTTVKVKLKNEEKEKKTIVPSTQAFIELIQEQVKNNNEIELIQKPENALLKISQTLITFLPTIIVLILFILIFKMQGLGDKGKVYDAESNKDTNTTFKDVAGLDEEKNELIEVVDFLKEPKKFQEMGAKIPRGILLCGKPGTGKTLIAKAIAGEAGVPFISMSGSEFIEMFAGLGASRVRKLFEKAKKIAPCIIFIDEIDAIGARRTNASGAESENNQTLNQLLVEMDGFDTNETVIVLAATNRPEMLDKALLRPGRFDRQITIAAPDARGREEILKIHGKNKKFADDIDLKNIAEDTAGFTGAELANVLNEAAIVATINKHKKIQMSDLEEAVKKVTVGLEKHSRVISDKDKRLTAYHEAGHAIVSKFLETQTDVKEVSIIPRGLAGGYTMYKTNEDKYYISKTEMEEKLIALLGGRAAEKIALNDISTGASNDIEVATEIAKDMVTVYGMSDTVGPICLKQKEPYENRILGENIDDVIGAEVKRMIDIAYKRAQEIILAHMDKLQQVAERLLEKEIISAEEFESFFQE